MKKLLITEVMRKQIADAVRAAQTDPNAALCCGGDAAIARCAAIVGPEFAPALQEWAYDATGCMQDKAYDDRHPDDWKRRMRRWSQETIARYIDRASTLDALYIEESN